MKKYEVFRDGDLWCAVNNDFINVQESPVGFGITPMVALGELVFQECEIALRQLPDIPYIWPIMQKQTLFKINETFELMLKEYLEYNPETGIFIWILKPNKRIKIGDNAGSLSHTGYMCIKFKGKHFLSHRIAWFLTYKIWPDKDIDHINGNKKDNRIINLRLATKSQNKQNQIKPSKNNKTGYLGVYYIEKSGKYEAQIMLNYKTKHIGYFNTAEEAHNEYLIKKREIHEFCTI